MAWHGQSLGELVGALHAEFGEYHYGRVDLEVKPGQKEKAVAYFSGGKLKKLQDCPVIRREDMEGIKLYLGEIGWARVRASGTQNPLRRCSQTSQPETTQGGLAAVTEIVHHLKP